jgi:hypothetical protein
MLVNEPQGLGLKRYRGSPGKRQPVRNVRRGFITRGRLELIANRDALIQLTHFRRSEEGVQIELANEDDLQQLFLVGFEVGENTNLLEYLQRQILRFIDNQHRARAQREQAEQEIVQRLNQLLFADVRQAAAFDVVARDNAEVLQDELERSSSDRS